MILERLAVSGFRKFVDPFEFVPDARLTVISAPNGTGKSTLLDALYYGLLERYGVTGEKANERFRSIGRDLTPSIEIDFAIDDQRYRLRKTFLSPTKSAQLQRFEAGRYVSLYDNTAAEDFLREKFCAEQSGRGALDPAKHLGLAHILWTPSSARFDEVPGVAGDQVRAMLGGAVSAVTEGERAVQERVGDEFLQFYTPAGGSYTTVATSRNIPALNTKVSQAESDLIAARDQYQKLQHLTLAFSDSKADADRMFEVRENIRRLIDGTRVDVKRYGELKLSEEATTHRCEEADRLLNDAVQRNLLLKRLRAECDELASAHATALAALQEAQSSAEGIVVRLNTVRQSSETAGAAHAAVQARAEEVTAAESYVNCRAEATRLESQIASYTAGAHELAELRATRNAIVAPSRDEMETLRRADQEAEVLKAKIEASAIALEIDAATDAEITVIAGNTVGALRLVPGKTAVILAEDDSVVVDVPGLGRLRARGADGAAKSRSKLRPLQEQLDAATEKYGRMPLPDLAALAARAEALQTSIEFKEQALAEKFGDATIDDLRTQLAALHVRASNIEQDHPTWSSLPPDAASLRANFDRDLREAGDALHKAQSDLKALEAVKADLDKKIGELTTRELTAKMQAQSNAEKRTEIEADGLSDLARSEQESALVSAALIAREQQKNVLAQLEKFVEDPNKMLLSLETSEQAAGKEYEGALSRTSALREQLNMQSSLGTYAKLNAAEELAAELSSQLRRAEAEALAIKCLRDAFETIRSERVAAIVAPVSTAATNYLGRIVGLPIGNVEIGNGLAPSGLREVISGSVLPIDSTLSSGEKEQIFLATRLALAEIIAKDRGRQLFVVDDAMTATDPNRFRRFVAILEELSQERLQIIVTTADRSRYLGIPGARHIDLAAAMSGAVAA